MSFGNPFGFLAFGAVGVIVCIHLLRVRARRVTISTLFLLGPQATSDRGGRRFQWLRSSPLLWLQLLSVLILGWLLVEPRWLREDSTQKVILVIDGSASMGAFEERTAEVLERHLARIEGLAAHTEWVVLGSDPREKTLYTGAARTEALEAALSWRPFLGTHDADPVLALARSVSGSGGRIVFVTDHVVELPPGVELLSAGRPLDNVGFASGTMSPDGRWRAIVKNSGARHQTRSWWLETANGSSAPESLRIGPGELRFLEGALEEGMERLELVLEADELTIDDRLPLVRPSPKPLAVYVAPRLDAVSFVERFLETLSPVERVARPDEADLSIADRIGPGSSIVLPRLERRASYARGSIVAERQPLVEGLGFDGLIVSGAFAFELEPDDRPLLWQGSRALVFLRGTPPTLVVNFDLSSSNADRVPAFVLALHRFAESVREAKVAYAQENVDTHQPLPVAADSRRGALELWYRGSSTPTLRAPKIPGFFEVRQGERTLLQGAAQFADPREGDLREAGSIEPDPARDREAFAVNSTGDPLSPLWFLALIGLATASFSLAEKRA